MTNLAPFVTIPIPVDRPWGGNRLSDMGKGTGRIAESWEIADLPDGVAPHVDGARTRVRSGPLEGWSLHDLIDRYGPDFLGSAEPTSEGDFPLLVKLLDAHEHLSVQVHPHRDYVVRHPDTRLKTESWYVIDAEPESTLFLDVVDGTEIEMTRRAIFSGHVRKILGERPAGTGAFHHLPAGMLHALGAGVLVAEVQTPSDTTFRVDDWRDLYDREERELHLEKAADALLIDPPGSIHLEASYTMGSRKMVTTDHYWIAEHRHTGGPGDLGTQPELRVLIVVAGTATVNGGRHSMGTTIVVPASAASTLDVQIDGAILEVGLV